MSCMASVFFYCVLHLQKLTICVLTCIFRSMTHQTAIIYHHFKVTGHGIILFRLYVPIFVTRYVTYVTNFCSENSTIIKRKFTAFPHQQWYKYFQLTVIGDFCKLPVRPLFSSLLPPIRHHIYYLILQIYHNLSQV